MVYQVICAPDDFPFQYISMFLGTGTYVADVPVCENIGVPLIEVLVQIPF